MDRLTVDTANEFRLYLQGFDDGAATAWRTLRELVRSGIDADALRSLIEHASKGGLRR